jgi:hypothetical protein
MDSSSGMKRRGSWSQRTWLAIAIGIVVVVVVAVILIAANMGGGSGGIY